MAVKMRIVDLDHLAVDAGFESYKSLLYELYVVRHLSLDDVGQCCHIHYRRVRKHLEQFGITVRSRGGRNNVKYELTPELLHEIMRDGVPTVAMRLGVESGMLYERLKTEKT
jgi:hypothetical protein